MEQVLETKGADPSRGECVVKVTLSSGKVVLLREMKMKYQTLAIKAVGSKAGDNTALLGLLSQQEVLKQLIVQIDGKTMTAKTMESLDELFSYQDIVQLMNVLGKISGGDMGEIQTENVIIGDK